MVALVHSDAFKEDQVRAPMVAVGGTWQAISENATIESMLQRVAQTGQSSQDRLLLYEEMLKKATAAVSSGVQLVPPDTMRAIVQTFERSMNTAAMIFSGQGAVLGNPQLCANQLLEVKVLERNLAWKMAGQRVGDARRRTTLEPC